MKRMYSGGCQCGKVRYEVSVELGEVIACNCSRCGKIGSLLAFTPLSEFKLQSGKDALTTYKFNKHVVSHRFCATCGIQPFAQGKMGDKPMVMINVRCVEGVDPESFPVRKYDGASK